MKHSQKYYENLPLVGYKWVGYNRKTDLHTFVKYIKPGHYRQVFTTDKDLENGTTERLLASRLNNAFSRV